jgi:hypothetical protein
MQGLTNVQVSIYMKLVSVSKDVPSASHRTGRQCVLSRGYCPGRSQPALLAVTPTFFSLITACQLDPRGPGGEIDVEAP